MKRSAAADPGRMSGRAPTPRHDATSVWERAAQEARSPEFSEAIAVNGVAESELWHRTSTNTESADRNVTQWNLVEERVLFSVSESITLGIIYRPLSHTGQRPWLPDSYSMEFTHSKRPRTKMRAARDSSATMWKAPYFLKRRSETKTRRSITPNRYFFESRRINSTSSAQARLVSNPPLPRKIPCLTAIHCPEPLSDAPEQHLRRDTYPKSEKQGYSPDRRERP